MNDTAKIELELDVLNDNNNTYVSVTDLYDVNIFTDKDMEAFQSREEQEKSNYINIQDSVFVTQTEQQNNMLYSTLFPEATAISKKQDITDKETYSNVGYAVIGIMTFVFFVLSMIQYHIYRAIRRKKDANTNNIYWKTGQH